MRKLTMEIKPNEATIKEQKPFFKDIHSYEILETLKIDYEEGICIDLIEFHLKEDVLIDELKSVGHMEILSILKSEDDKHTCLIKYFEPEDSKEQFKETDLNLIFTKPNIVSENKITVSCIGAQENLLKFVEMIKENAGEIVSMSFKKAVYQKHDIISVLTEKQRDALIAAHKHGYYDYPKKITSKQLSEKVNISKPTLVQHLRKAEGRILGEILIGHS